MNNNNSLNIYTMSTVRFASKTRALACRAVVHFVSNGGGSLRKRMSEKKRNARNNNNKEDVNNYKYR